MGESGNGHTEESQSCLKTRKNEAGLRTLPPPLLLPPPPPPPSPPPPPPPPPRLSDSNALREVDCPSLKSRLSFQMQRLSVTLNEGFNRGNDLVVLVFEVKKLSWFQKHITFFHLHVTYFITIGFLGSLLIYLIPLSNSKRLHFVDALYTSFSALCMTGLQTVKSQDLTYSHYSVILVLMTLGAPILTSLLPVYVRRFYFHLCIKQHSDGNLQEVERPNVFSTGNAKDGGPKTSHQDGAPRPGNEKKLLDLKSMQRREKRRSMDSKDSCTVTIDRDDTKIENIADYHAQRMYDEVDKYNWKLSLDAKQALRTLEYRALVALSWVVICFFFWTQIIGFLLAAFYFISSPLDAKTVEGEGMNPIFYSFFTSVSVFTNSGYNLNNNSMVDFQDLSFLMVLFTVLAALGNSLYAPFLRLLVWIQYRFGSEKDREVYDYLLLHPRRCFTNLFPNAQTMWLLAIFFGFTGLQLVFFCALEWNDALAGVSTPKKLLDGVYQAVGTRNAGGSVVNMSQLAPAVLFLSMLMMYISNYPVFLSRQTSNDETQYDDTELVVSDNYKQKTMNPDRVESILVLQSRRLLARDTSYLFFAIFFLLQLLRKMDYNWEARLDHSDVLRSASRFTR